MSTGPIQLAKIQFPRKKVTYTRKIIKRSYKNFTQDKWIKELQKQDWSKMEEEMDVNKMVELYTEFNTHLTFNMIYYNPN